MKLSQQRATKHLLLVLFLLVLLLVSIVLSKEREIKLLGLLNKVPAKEVLQVGTYKVVRVEDGDTITIDMNGREEKVRFIGVDTPETHDPRKTVQCFGKTATNYTKQVIGDQPVRLESDILSTNRDRYNRLLRYVYLPDGTLLNAKLISEGYGFAYISFPFEKALDFKNLEKEARQHNRGLWNKCQPFKNEFGNYTSSDAH